MADSPALHYIFWAFCSKFKSITFNCQWQMQGKDNGLNSCCLPKFNAKFNYESARQLLLPIILLSLVDTSINDVNIENHFFAFQYKEARKPWSFASLSTLNGVDTRTTSVAVNSGKLNEVDWIWLLVDTSITINSVILKKKTLLENTSFKMQPLWADNLAGGYRI